MQHQEDSRSAANSPPDLLALAFHAAPNGFVLIDREGCIIAANEALARMFGYPRDDLTRLPLEALLPEHHREAHVGLRHGFFAHPEPRPMGAGRILYARHQDGHAFPVEIGLTPLPAPDGLRVLASVVDISERLGLESAFAGLFDNSPYGQLIVDDQGHILAANRAMADMLGHVQSGLVGRPLSMLLPERYRGRHGALIAHYLTEGVSRRMGQGRDLTALHTDGTEIPVEIGLSRVRWRRQVATLAVVSDIGPRKRLELELQQRNAELQEFTYVASHDLRSPLRGIADLVEWITADLGEQPPDDVKRNLDRVTQRIQRMERLIDDLLRYARAGQASAEFRPVSLNQVVDNILELQPLPAGFTLTRSLDVPTLQAAQTPLETVLRNLLSNAVKHHDRDQGHLDITASLDDNYCQIDVSDDGPGVPPASRERIFKLFQTLTSNERRGSGIGLALTKRLVEVHGGRIEVISPWRDGRGACFRFRWPRFQRRLGHEPN